MTTTTHAPRLTADRYAGRTFYCTTGRLAGRWLTVRGRLWGSGFYSVLVDGARLAWCPGHWLRAAINARDAARRGCMSI